MGLGGTTGVSQLLLLVAVVLIVGTTLLRTQRYFSRMKRSGWRPPQVAGSRNTGGSVSVPPPDQLAAWEVQMHETARDLTGQLDSKMRALEVLIGQANEAAARLEAVLGQAAQHDTVGQPAGESLPVDAPQAAQEHTEDLAEPPQVRSSQADALQAAVEQAGQAGASQPHDVLEEESTARRREEVYLLADYGFPPVEIARRVGVPIGEVELMLRLRRAG